ncbi:MAG: O-antigen ligase family protein [Patescibacteria group bacterium]
MPKLFDKTYFTAILLFILVEILSFFAFYFQLFNTITFITILVLTAIISWIKYEFGLFILLSELIVGSKGYLFSIPITDEKALSIRLGIFLVIFFLGIFKIIKDLRSKNSRFAFWHSKLRNYYVLLAIALVWGVIWAIIRKISLTDIFFDTNAYLYFALTPILYQLIIKREQIYGLLKVFLAAITYICVKSMFLLFIFSHLVSYTRPVYQWVRDSGWGEVTLLAGNFFRVFSQSQIYALIGFFVIFSLIFLIKREEKNRNLLGLFILLALTCSTLILSLSRSFWLAGAAVYLIALLILLFKFRYSVKQTIKIAAISIGIAAISIGLIAGLVKFPWPRANVELLALSSRFQITGEAAVSSRWSQLPALAQAIARHPVIGSGFGQTVTYISQDPRVLEANPTGEYTTYAFEWGYLDQILKFGLAGLAIYLLLIYKIWKSGWQAIKNLDFNFDKALIVGLLLGLLALLGTHMFSPYLNHPLGIGFIILTSVWVELYANSVNRQTVKFNDN